jgi:DNA-binding transcriptional LysR family regulator
LKVHAQKNPQHHRPVSFEAAARHESFTKAAQNFPSPGAICRQIASLEDFLSVELFRRSRGVKLTEAGLSYSRQSRRNWTPWSAIPCP